MKAVVNVLAGAFGAGKTTAIRALLEAQPKTRWAVVVNDFGPAGIDARTLADLAPVREVLGACVCCAAGPLLPITLVRLLREVRPERLLLEPSGAADLAALLDQLSHPGLAAHLERRATILLEDPTLPLQPAALARREVAEVLVASRADLTSPQVLERWARGAAELWPPRTVGFSRHGQLDPAWLDLPAGGRPRFRPLAEHDHALMAVGLGFEGSPVAWAVWEEALRRLARGLGDGPRVVRAKGLIHLPQGWRRVDVLPDELSVRPTAWRGDVRLEVVAEASAGSAPGALAAILLDWAHHHGLPAARRLDEAKAASAPADERREARGLVSSSGEAD